MKVKSSVVPSVIIPVLSAVSPPIQFWPVMFSKEPSRGHEESCVCRQPCGISILVLGAKCLQVSWARDFEKISISLTMKFFWFHFNQKTLKLCMTLWSSDCIGNETLQKHFNSIVYSDSESKCKRLKCLYLGIFREFHKHTELAKMAILASEVLLRENKKKPVIKCYPSECWIC